MAGKPAIVRHGDFSDTWINFLFADNPGATPAPSRLENEMLGYWAILLIKATTLSTVM
jgi:hypothetical protein